MLFVVLAIAFGISSCGGRSDEAIQQQVNDTLQANGNLAQVTATVNDGLVNLSGTCTGADCVAQLEEKIKSIDGVESIQNDVQMSPEVTDLTLRTEVQNIISKYPGVQADVAAGEIVLRGSINRDQLQPLITELNAANPKKIDNQLAVK